MIIKYFHWIIFIYKRILSSVPILELQLPQIVLNYLFIEPPLNSGINQHEIQFYQL